jgi:hypothetical protein
MKSYLAVLQGKSTKFGSGYIGLKDVGGAGWGIGSRYEIRGKNNNQW